MRDLKFKVYYELEGEFNWWFMNVRQESQRVSTPSISTNGKILAVVEYTGMKDKNGEEIYEGDLLKREIKTPGTDEANIFYEEVIHKPGAFKTKDLRNKDRSPMWLGNYTWHSIEVIGNIYFKASAEKKELSKSSIE